MLSKQCYLLKDSTHLNNGVARTFCGSGELALEISDLGDGDAMTLGVRGAEPSSTFGASSTGIFRHTLRYTSSQAGLV